MALNILLNRDVHRFAVESRNANRDRYCRTCLFGWGRCQKATGLSRRIVLAAGRRERNRSQVDQVIICGGLGCGFVTSLVPAFLLEAEAIRDAILHVTDGLDLTIGESFMPLKDRAYVIGTAWKRQRYENPRRTVYQTVYRSAVYDVLSSFDFPDPATLNGDPSNFVVTPQALLMMNCSLVESSADRLANTLLRRYSTDSDRIQALYEQAY